MLIDRFGRKITYMRLSVTDRCNLRCVYCMPENGITWQPHEKIMRFEEMIKILEVAVKNGIDSVRLTGGEPLVRKGIAKLIKLISDIEGIKDISLTTNGILLKDMAQELADAGLNRLNISLDTLQAKRYKRITRVGDWDQVWNGIIKAEEAGLSPIKINAVVINGINDDEICDMAMLTMEKEWHIRFIEFMPFNDLHGLDLFAEEEQDPYFSVQDMISKLKPLGLSYIGPKVGSGPAEVYKINNAKGYIGFIAPVGDHFCKTCNRLRLTADGNLRPCLLSNKEIPVLPAIRAGEPIFPYLQKAVDIKPISHHLSSQASHFSRCMMQIGG